VRFGPSSVHTVGGELVSKLLAKVSTLPKSERAPLEAPPADMAGRTKLVRALCETATGGAEGGGGADGGSSSSSEGLSLREAWAAVALCWALRCPSGPSVAASLGWFEVLTRHRQLTYAELHRLVAFFAASVDAGRLEVAMATLDMLREHTSRLHSLNYRGGVLLCVAAVVGMNCARVDVFATAQALLRACIDRDPASGVTRPDSTCS
jgi:hypothetical protein